VGFSCGPWALHFATLNIVRAGRPDDKTLVTITSIGTACWALVAFGFGVSIHNVWHPRPLGHVVISIILVFFSGITLWRASTAKTSPLQRSRHRRQLGRIGRNRKPDQHTCRDSPPKYASLRPRTRRLNACRLLVRHQSTTPRVGDVVGIPPTTETIRSFQLPAASGMRKYSLSSKRSILSLDRRALTCPHWKALRSVPIVCRNS
jgi:hypothetical protein